MCLFWLLLLFPDHPVNFFFQLRCEILLWYLPQDLSASVDTVVKLDGVISDETRLALLPLDIDPKEELEKVEEQKLSNFSLFGSNFNEVDDGEEDRTREER